MYKVIKYFTDLQDNNFIYNVGDTYPRKGFEVLPSRIKELSGKKNKQGTPLIEKVSEETNE
nr:MAG TPA: hypothetical protein [Caudoviricetes sp.]